MTQGAILRNPRTKYKRSKNVFSVTSIALIIGRDSPPLIQPLAHSPIVSPGTLVPPKKLTFYHKLFQSAAKSRLREGRGVRERAGGLQKLGRWHRYTLSCIVSLESVPFQAPRSPTGPPSEVIQSFLPNSVFRGAGRRGSPTGRQSLVNSNQ